MFDTTHTYPALVRGLDIERGDIIALNGQHPIVVTEVETWTTHTENRIRWNSLIETGRSSWEVVDSGTFIVLGRLSIP